MIEVEANIAEGTGSNEFGLWNKFRNVKRDEGEAIIKVLVVLLLIPFGILTFGRAFPDQYDVIIFNNIMLILLIIILSLGTILYGFIIFPRGQETNREETFVTEEKLTKYFTHILALIITVPLIVVTCVLLVGGNRSEGLTFISGLLGVIIGFYFGHRGVESAESQREKAESEVVARKKEAEEAEERWVEAERVKRELENMANIIKEDGEKSKKDEAWNQFKKQVKNIHKDFKGVENIDKYLPWEEEPEGGWNNEERKYIMQFEEEWKLLGGE